MRIDRKRKLPVTTLLLALGLSPEDILNEFYGTVSYVRGKNGWQIPYFVEAWRGQKPTHEVVDADTGEVVFKSGEKILRAAPTPRPRRASRTSSSRPRRSSAASPAHDLINEKTGEIYIEAGEEVTAENLEKLDNAGVDTLELLDIDFVNTGPWMRNTLKADKNEDADSALADIYRVMRPGEPPTRETADLLFYGLFFDPERYDLSAVGRVKLNMRLGLDAEDTVTTLRREDILAVVQELVNLKDGKGEIDDIDNLANRRVRSVGELLENQYPDRPAAHGARGQGADEQRRRIDGDAERPHQRQARRRRGARVLRSSQLSQFMDQTNPLSAHKRRVSALGPGGLTRERAGFEVRDVHPTRYGRICPIETPEGPNIGLINSLASFSRVNKYGFIETPYRRVVDGKVTSDVVYLSAMEEAKHTIAQANAELNADGTFGEEIVSARRAGDFLMAPRDQITLMDVSPKQLVSVAASLIPFLENDDANRALMGSNMQRQAVPLIRAEAPLVGTGMEEDGGARFRRCDRGPPLGHRRPGRRGPHRGSRHRRAQARGVGRGHLHADEVPALEPEHLHQPAPAGEGR